MTYEESKIIDELLKCIDKWVRNHHGQCSFTNCNEPLFHDGYCVAHYNAARKRYLEGH